MTSDPRVFVTRRIPKEGIDLLSEVASVEVWPDRLPPPREELIKEAARSDGLLTLLTDRIDQELMDAAPRLRVVANYAVGYDNIDVESATSRGIWVTNTPGVLTEATADFSFALLLAAARRVVEGDRATRGGQWLTWEPTYMLGAAVHAKTLGIVGMGRIGESVARRARGFSMEILYTDPNSRPDLEVELGIRQVELDELLSTSDFISLHAPLNDNTRGLIGERELRVVKPGAILINTARGELVDEGALVPALESGPLGAAGLDVYRTEPIPGDHPLLRLDNVVLAPHLGSATVEARTAMAEVAAGNLVSVLGGGRPQTPVNDPGGEGQGS